MASISIALVLGKPAIDRVLEAAVFNEGMSNMNLLASTVREVASEGVGSTRTMQLGVGGGSYRADNATSSIYFDYRLRSGIISPGTFTRRGDVYVNGSALTAASDVVDLQLRLNYTRIAITWDGNTIGKGTNKLCMEKTDIQDDIPVVNVRRC